VVTTCMFLLLAAPELNISLFLYSAGDSNCLYKLGSSRLLTRGYGEDLKQWTCLIFSSSQVPLRNADNSLVNRFSHRYL
jgi:hypothetical protein